MPLKTPKFSLFSNLIPSEKKPHISAQALTHKSEKKEPLPLAPIKPIPTEKKVLEENVKAPTQEASKPKTASKSSYKKRERSFASMEKLIESIDPSINIYKEDVELKRKKVFFSFPKSSEKGGLFYNRLKNAIQGHLADVDEAPHDSEKELKSCTELFSEASVILFANDSFHRSPLKAHLHIEALDKKCGYTLGTFEEKPFIILEPTDAYSDAALKKSLWSYLQELLHGA